MLVAVCEFHHAGEVVLAESGGAGRGGCGGGLGEVHGGGVALQEG